MATKSSHYARVPIVNALAYNCTYSSVSCSKNAQQSQACAFCAADRLNRRLFTSHQDEVDGKKRLDCRKKPHNQCMLTNVGL